MSNKNQKLDFCIKDNNSINWKKMQGYTLIELIFAMIITLIILGIAVATFSSALSSRQRESSKTDAITSAQAALNIMSREIGNSGFGLKNNGIVWADSNDKRIHFRTNVVNTNNNGSTIDSGEDVTFYFDADSESVVRYDANANITSGIINRVSDVDFVYHNYLPGSSSSTEGAASIDTARITIKLKVILGDVQGQPTDQSVLLTSDVTLRNSTYNLGQY